MPILFAEHVGNRGHWGETLREYMRDFVHRASFGALCEFLPLAHIRVTLSSHLDRDGLPIANFSYSMRGNDRALMKAASSVLTEIHERTGAEEEITIDRYDHLVEWCRMAEEPAEGVVDADLRTFAVPNLYITDGSVVPTQGRANTALTIMARAARAADHLSSANRGWAA
jgi:choline dehydrogenase-like flavoprotein